MRITETGLRRIIREELNEMRGGGKPARRFYEGQLVQDASGPAPEGEMPRVGVVVSEQGDGETVMVAWEEDPHSDNMLPPVAVDVFDLEPMRPPFDPEGMTASDLRTLTSTELSDFIEQCNGKLPRPLPTGGIRPVRLRNAEAALRGIQNLRGNRPGASAHG